MKVPEKVGGSVEPRKLGSGDSSNASGTDRASVAAGRAVRDRVSQALGTLLGEASGQAAARREERLEALRRAVADGSYRPDLEAAADGLLSDRRLSAGLNSIVAG
jgi:anti-sigma28 factor (negative regulator of flagellin synthesis)